MGLGSAGTSELAGQSTAGQVQGTGGPCPSAQAHAAPDVCLLPASVLLAKARHMAKSKIKGKGCIVLLGRNSKAPGKKVGYGEG